MDNNNSWSEDDDRESFRHGWAIFDYDGTGILVIMKIDDIREFRLGKKETLRGIKVVSRPRSDNAAYTLVKAHAYVGSATAKKALEMCPRQEEYLSGAI